MLEIEEISNIKRMFFEIDLTSFDVLEDERFYIVHKITLKLYLNVSEEVYLFLIYSNGNK